MNEVVLKKDLIALESKIDKHFDGLTALMSNFANQTNDRINKIESKFDTRFDLLTNIIDGYAGKIDTYAQEMAAMDHKINRLEKYIQILADNAGIDLDKIHA